MRYDQDCFVGDRASLLIATLSSGVIYKVPSIAVRELLISRNWRRTRIVDLSQVEVVLGIYLCLAASSVEVKCIAPKWR